MRLITPNPRLMALIVYGPWWLQRTDVEDVAQKLGLDVGWLATGKPRVGALLRFR